MEGFSSVYEEMVAGFDIKKQEWLESWLVDILAHRSILAN